MAMATRTAMTVASLISPIIAVHYHKFDFLNPSFSSSSSPASADYASSSNRNTKKSSQTDRLSAVINAANDRKLPPELRGQRNNVRSETDIVNIVEKRIWQSMEEGHFEKLPGKGKPLDLSTNPHAAPDEDTLYRVLSKNGCAPEWVELNKQIRSDAAEWRSALKKAWAYKVNGNVAKWTECSETLKAGMSAINNKFVECTGISL
ncbi:uncharacterized protein LOC110734683 isoform X1 [Chenopodium quinoa]|uniref:uncharacterized protein LOC110734683 isoform X1 n=1 Tax=Chenopodium quinoa TaxID=63459 RepID=UPI000B77F2AE|nr:uncharacterized protein LOC110734683 isoform X1 [Chenopodium quinoa]